MRSLVPLALLTLAACDPPMEEITPARYYYFERENVAYDVRAQYDPLVAGWFVRVWSLEYDLDFRDKGRAIQIVEQDLGPRLCGGGQMEVRPGDIWNGLAGDRIQYMPDLAAWQFVASCA
jgi:hypothetical protein